MVQFETCSRSGGPDRDRGRVSTQRMVRYLVFSPSENWRGGCHWEVEDKMPEEALFQVAGSPEVIKFSFYTRVHVSLLFAFLNEHRVLTGMNFRT